MAVAVASISHTPQVAGLNAQSAQDALLDALLSSCEKPKISPLPSFGRDLKPYFLNSDCSASFAFKQEGKSSQKGSHTTKYIKATIPAVATAAAEAAASTKPKKFDSTTAIKSTAGAKKKSPIAKTKSAMPKKETTTAVLEKPSPPFHQGEMAALLSWAGPGFCVAPSPDKLPLPTNLLLE